MKLNTNVSPWIKVLLISFLILVVLSNAVNTFILIKETQDISANLQGVIAAQQVGFGLIGQSEGRITTLSNVANFTSSVAIGLEDRVVNIERAIVPYKRPNFLNIVNGTVIINNGKRFAAGVCIKKDKDYCYIITVNHIVGKIESRPTVIIPESNQGKVIRSKVIERFLRSDINKVNPRLYPDIRVTLYNYDIYKAEVIKVDTYYDLALIRISVNEEINVIQIAQSYFAGDKIFVCGHPLGVYYNITEGIISNLEDVKIMVIDAATTFGNSGGGVFNGDEELLGICYELPYYFSYSPKIKEEE